ncbi:MAG: transporter [Curvibacter sp. PD_MW3]|nr:MAG: transporter [Curvibacter sp. PD_MW3]
MRYLVNWKPLVCLLLWPAMPAWAQPAAAPAVMQAPQEGPSLTLPELISTILVHNPGLQAARRLRDQAAAGIKTAGALANPRLEWSEGQTQARLASAMPGRVQGWALSQFIENPSLRGARVEAARSVERGSAHQIDALRSELVAQVQLRAYEYLLRRAEAQAAAEDVTLLEQVRERVRLRVESGEAARYEIIKADAEIINARQRQQNAALQAEQVLLGMNRMAAGQLPQRWSLSGALAEESRLRDLDDMQRRAQANNPELKMLQSQLERARSQVTAARASRWPGVELRYTETTDVELRHGMLGVQMQIPLLDQRAGPIAEAGADEERMRIKLEGRQAELHQQLRQAWKSLEMARLRVEALGQGAMREAEAALRVAQAAYRFGERGILDVLDARRVLQSVRADLLDARYQVQAARIELEYLAGDYAEDKL